MARCGGKQSALVHASLDGLAPDALLLSVVVTIHRVVNTVEVGPGHRLPSVRRTLRSAAAALLYGDEGALSVGTSLIGAVVHLAEKEHITFRRFLHHWQIEEFVLCLDFHATLLC